MQLRHGVQIKFLQIKNLTGGHLAQFWVHSTFRVQLIVLHAVTCNIFLNFILSYLQNQTDKTPQWKLPMARPNSIHLPPGSVHGSLLSHVDVPLSQAGKYSLFMLCCWPRFLRMTGSVPRKLLSVAEYSSLSAERQTRTLESNSAFQPPAAHNERSAVQRGEGKEKIKKKRTCETKVREMGARRLSRALACKVELDSGTLGAILWMRSRWRARGEKFFILRFHNIIIYYSDCWQKQTRGGFLLS